MQILLNLNCLIFSLIVSAKPKDIQFTIINECGLTI